MNWRAIFLTTVLGVVGSLIADSAVVEFADDTFPQFGTDADFPRLEECPFEVKTAIEVVTSPTRPGPLRLKLTVVPKVECNDISVTIDKLDKLQCTSPLNWTFSGKVGDTIIYYIDLVIPASDTSAFDIWTGWCGVSRWSGGTLSFVADTVSVRCYPYDFRFSDEAQERARAEARAERQRVFDSGLMVAQEAIWSHISAGPIPDTTNGAVIDTPRNMFDMDINPIHMVAEDSVVRLRLLARGDAMCKDVRIRILSDHVRCLGDTSFQFDLATGDTLKYDFDIVVPRNDSGGLQIFGTCFNTERTRLCYFNTTDDTIQMRGCNTRNLMDQDVGRRFDSVMGTSFFVTPPQDVAAPGRNYSAENAARYDSLKAESDARKAIRKAEKLQQQIEKKQLLEQSPLLDADRQRIQVGDTAYFRTRGEVLFQKWEPTQNFRQQIIERRKRNHREPTDIPMDILIDLRDSSWLEQVRLRVDSLIPTDRVGFYRIRSTLELRLFLRENRIRFNRVDEVPAGRKQMTLLEANRKTATVRRQTILSCLLNRQVLFPLIGCSMKIVKAKLRLILHGCARTVTTSMATTIGVV